MAALTVGTSAVQIPAVGKQRPFIQNLGPGIVYLGEDNTVSSTNGVKLIVDAAFELYGAISSDGAFWVISDTAGTDVRYLALGG